MARLVMISVAQMRFRSSFASESRQTYLFFYDAGCVKGVMIHQSVQPSPATTTRVPSRIPSLKPATVEIIWYLSDEKASQQSTTSPMCPRKGTLRPQSLFL